MKIRLIRSNLKEHKKKRKPIFLKMTTSDKSIHMAFVSLSLGLTFTNSFLFMLGETNSPQWNESRACWCLSESHSEMTFVQWTCVCVSDRDGYSNKVCCISHHPLLLERFFCPCHQSSGNSLTLLFPVFIIINIWLY